MGEKPEYYNQDKPPVYKIHTLGRFDVVKDNQSLVMRASDSKKIWELYKFMLTHRDKSFTPEMISDHLWISEEYANPRSTIRRQMFRLRQLLDEPAENNAETTVVFNNGYYSWNSAVPLTIDKDQFEALTLHAATIKETDSENAIIELSEALSLYKGDFLPDCLDQHWVFPVRNYYRRLYNQAAMMLFDLLKFKEAYDDIIKHCQSAIKIDVYEIDFHLAYMNALYFKGEQKQALEHYQHITSFLYREMGIKPSDEMKAFYKQLLKAHPVIQKDRESLLEALNQHSPIENAFYCDPEVFKSICELERRRSQRSGIDFTIAVLEMKSESKYTLAQERLRMGQLRAHLLRNLRKGDSITQWNERQFVLLLPGLDSTLMETALSRVLNNFALQNAVTINQISQLTNELTNDLKPQASR